jgi:nucleotide-binding universal stress UspA family protein
MNILLATDGSPYSEAAIREVAGRTWPAGSEVKVLSVFEPPFAPTADALYTSSDYFAEAEKKARAAVDEAVSALEAREDKALKVTPEVASGSAKKVIVDVAEEWGADLIVVGSHGYPALKRLLLGSVSQALALHAPCSVEIVRGRANGN